MFLKVPSKGKHVIGTEYRVKMSQGGVITAPRSRCNKSKPNQGLKSQAGKHTVGRYLVVSLHFYPKVV